MNNELLHGQEYEEITKDPTYTQDIFRRVHQLDPGPKLFLNDYNVVAVGANTDVGKHKFTIDVICKHVEGWLPVPLV